MVDQSLCPVLKVNTWGESQMHVINAFGKAIDQKLRRNVSKLDYSI